MSSNIEEKETVIETLTKTYKKFKPSAIGDDIINKVTNVLSKYRRSKIYSDDLYVFAGRCPNYNETNSSDNKCCWEWHLIYMSDTWFGNVDRNRKYCGRFDSIEYLKILIELFYSCSRVHFVELRFFDDDWDQVSWIVDHFRSKDEDIRGKMRMFVSYSEDNFNNFKLARNIYLDSSLKLEELENRIFHYDGYDAEYFDKIRNEKNKTLEEFKKGSELYHNTISGKLLDDALLNDVKHQVRRVH